MDAKGWVDESLSMVSNPSRGGGNRYNRSHRGCPGHESRGSCLCATIAAHGDRPQWSRPMTSAPCTLRGRRSARRGPAEAVSAPAQAGTGAQLPRPCNACCDIPVWHAFGEYLLLRPRNEGIEYAVPINGPIAAGQVPLQVGPTATVDPQFQSGFRVGFERVLNQCSSISLSYAYYRNDANNGPVTADTPYVLHSMVFNPSSADAAADLGIGQRPRDHQFQPGGPRLPPQSLELRLQQHQLPDRMRYAQLGQQFEPTSSPSFPRRPMRTSSSTASACVWAWTASGRLAAGSSSRPRRTPISSAASSAATTCKAMPTTPSSPRPPGTSAIRHHPRTEVAVGWQSSDGHIRTSVGYRSATG